MSYCTLFSNGGSISGAWVKFRSGWFRVDHDGIVGVPSLDGTPTIVHQAPGGVRVEEFERVRDGRPFEYVWVPTTTQERDWVLNRAYSRLGRPYDALSENCEQFASWVVTGKPQSPQLVAYAGLGAVGLCKETIFFI